MRVGIVFTPWWYRTCRNYKGDAFTIEREQKIVYAFPIAILCGKTRSRVSQSIGFKEEFLITKTKPMKDYERNDKQGCE